MSTNACDLLICNGQIITMDAARTIYTPGAVAITDSRIVIHLTMSAICKNMCSVDGSRWSMKS